MDADAKLRIIHCFRSPVGGIFRHVRDLAEQQHKEGHAVGIVCDSITGGEHEEKLFEQIMPYLALGLTRLPIHRSIGPSDFPALWKTYKKIESLRPDVLHGHGSKGGVLARTIGSALRVKRYSVARFYSPHGGSLHFDPARLSGKLVFAAERMLERLADGLLFVCDYERQVYQTKVGRPRCDARVAHNGIGEREIRPVAAGENAVKFLYIGMLRDLKGPDLFIEAFAKTERLIGRPLSAAIVGDGPDEEKYRQMKTRWGLGQRISMHPAMPVRQAFALADIIVVPSRAEAMPYIVLEALGAGKTVIASRVGGIPEVLGADSRALVNPGDTDDFARVMAEAATDDGWQAEVMPTPESFRARFSSQAMAHSILTAYRHALSRIRG
ncbi:glycosyltransferase family 4 protein [Rhizobium halophytocola]|uniref:Glycosyltransferase involved in cell wall biosynthesis n=1 Tax=Rhizobium halophytocola TaxID=735519 RepID=A0ABS4DY97_9HYPH|nr:glycosyltransferase family 4 protein [Rhizobium halophytocola]MBP1850666.1 glycosyltransferase involved in cell wall biosynthesis [Rhizobium halophytocola]